MSRKTRKLMWSVPVMAVLAIAGALAMFAAQVPGSVFANPLPAAPANLMVAPASGDAGRTTLVLTWDAVDGATGYRIDASDNGFVWETLVAADAGHTMTTYMEDGLTSEDTRWYRVFAVNDHGVGPVSSPNSGETDERVMPGSVRNFTATADGRNQINLTWDPPMDDGGEKITAYEIQYYNTGVDDPNWYGLLSDGSGTAEGNNAATAYLLVTQADYMKNGGYEDKDSTTLSLDPGDSRMYRIRAVNVAIPDDRATLTAADRSKDWVEATGMTQAAANPGAPTGLTAVNTAEGTVRLYWFDPENNGGWGITNYVIQVRRNVSGADWKDLPDVPDAGGYAADAFDTEPIATEESYNFRIDDAGAQVHQAEFTSVPPTYDADGDAGTAGDNTPVGWQFRVLAETTDDGDDDSATEADDNVIRRSTGTSEVATIRAVARPDDIDDTLEAPDVTATARVSATDAGTSEVQQINLTINIASTARNVTTQNAYRIDVSDDMGATWKQLVRDTRFTGFGTDREYEHVGLPYDKTMYYRVFTVGTDWRRNVGPASTLVTGSTRASAAPGKPTGVMASSPDLETIMASWSAPEKHGGQPVSNYRYRYVLDDGDGQPDAGDFAGTDTARPIGAGNTGNADLMATIEVDADPSTADVADPLTKDQTYWFQVAAINENPLDSDNERPAAGSEMWSDAVKFTTGDPNPPNMVEGLMSQLAMDTNGNVAGVLLLWNKPSDGPDVASYEVQRKIGDGEWAHPTDDAEESTEQRTSFTDPRHHMMGEMLAYQVRAVNAAGESEWAMVYYPRDPGDHEHNVAPMAPTAALADQTVAEGASVTVQSTITDANMGDTLTWTEMSTDDMIASSTVDNMGMVTITGVAAGSATITVTATDQDGLYAMQTIAVTVEAAMLTAPSSVTVCSAGDPGCPDVTAGQVKVTWTDGANAIGHLVLLFDTSDYSLASPAATMQEDGMTTFSNLAAGSYLAVVVAYDAEANVQLAISGVATVGN